MIDWVTVDLPCEHWPLRSGLVCRVDADGQIEWATRCRVPVEGSFSSVIQVQSVGGDGQGRATHLSISGNPSKWLQGHNIFGSDDVHRLIHDCFVRLFALLPLSPSIADLRAIQAGHYRFRRLDINYSFCLRNRSDVLAWLRAAEFKSKTRHGRPY